MPVCGGQALASRRGLKALAWKRRLTAVERDDLVQAAERALFDAENAYRAEPSDTNRRRVMKAWSEVLEARGEPPHDDADAPFPFSPRPG